MTKKIPILRVAGPTLLVSLILFGVCTAAAVFLYRLHARTAETLADDIESRKVAAEIETTLRLLVAIHDGSDQVDTHHVDTHHGHLRKDLLPEARKLANTEEEKKLVANLEQKLKSYQDLWDNRYRENPEVKDPVQEALKILKGETLPAAAQVRVYNARQIDNSEKALRRTVRGIAWALAGVGLIGSLGGILFGYSVARAFRHSIYKLSVRIQDAAHKLRHDLPTVTFQQGEGIDYLHDQMKSLVKNIEEVVERLQQRDREVLRAEQMAAVGQLAAGMAHELRNPLTAVKMLVQASREDLENRGLPGEDLQIIEKELQRLERSLQTFLDFARPPRMERRRTDLVAVVQEALSLVGGRARKQGVQITITAPEEPVWLEADGSQIRQLLVNLAMNSLDAMPNGGMLTLQLRIIADQKESVGESWVEVQVGDTGPGIAADLMPRLFQPFVSGKETGLGLGLVVSRRIAEDHGGSLVADTISGDQGSKVQGQNSGARFILRLPVSKEIGGPVQESPVRNQKSEVGDREPVLTSDF